MLEDKYKPGMVAHVYNPITQEDEGDFEFEASLSSIVRSCLTAKAVTSLWYNS